MPLDNHTKNVIVDRLHKSNGKCMCCGEVGVRHGNTTLPDYLKTDDVLKAINCDEYFFKEETVATQRQDNNTNEQ